MNPHKVSVLFCQLIMSVVSSAYIQTSEIWLHRHAGDLVLGGVASSSALPGPLSGGLTRSGRFSVVLGAGFLWC